MLDQPGGAWTAAFQERCNQLSLSMFGVIEADTKPAEPHPDDFGENSRHSFSDTSFASYNTALQAWYDWQQVIGAFQRDIEELGSERYWRRYGLDVTTEDGSLLRCLPLIERQLFAAIKGVLPGAKVTWDGTGRRGSQSVEEWGAALAAEAARFRPSR